MNAQTKKCPLCAETIPLESAECEYCGAKFSVTITGYCTNCHEMRPADANCRCQVCGTEVADRRVESKFIEEAGSPLAASPAPALAPGWTPTPAGIPTSIEKPVGTKTRQNQSWIRILVGCIGGLIICAVLAEVVWTQRDNFPLVSRLFSTPTSTPMPTTAIPIPTDIITPGPTATDQAAWVGTFAQPILSEVDKRKPNFQDDFSYVYGSVSAYWTELGQDVSFRDGVLRFEAKNEWTQAGGPLDAADFVLKFDVTPQILSDSICFGVDFRIGDKRWYYLSFHPGDKHGGIGIYLNDAWVEEFISADVFDLSRAVSTSRIILIVRGKEFAFYINGNPVAYASYSYLITDSWSHFWVDSPSGYSIVDFDNVQFWDLHNLNP